MRPGRSTDAVRVFTLPDSGWVTITGTVHKDIYHTSGDGVRVKIVKGNQQIWPHAGWESIAADDTSGKKVDLTISVNAGDRLYFIVNRNFDNMDDETVWNPQVKYLTAPKISSPKFRTQLDDVDHAIKYSGGQWQTLGTPHWVQTGNGANTGGDWGYLTGRFKGTLSLSGTAGNKMMLKFHGTGVEILGDTASDHGIAEISLDGVNKGTIDTFIPVNSLTWDTASSDLATLPTHLAVKPPIVLWATSGLSEGDHTLEITVTGQKNRESTGTYIGIDEVHITGSAIDDINKP